MKIQNLILVLAAASCSCLVKTLSQTNNSQSAPPNTPVIERSEWQAASWKGVSVGRSKRSTLFTAFGKPIASELPRKAPEGTEIKDEFHVLDEIAGKIEAYSSSRSGIVKWIILYPDNLSVKGMEHIFGEDYITKFYGIMDCGYDNGEGILKEDPAGDVEYIEYPHRGIAAQIGSKGNVLSIEFLSKPLANEKECRPKGGGR